MDFIWEYYNITHCQFSVFDKFNIAIKWDLAQLFNCNKTEIFEKIIVSILGFLLPKPTVIPHIKDLFHTRQVVWNFP